MDILTLKNTVVERVLISLYFIHCFLTSSSNILESVVAIATGQGDSVEADAWDLVTTLLECFLIVPIVFVVMNKRLNFAAPTLAVTVLISGLNDIAMVALNLDPYKHLIMKKLALAGR